MRTLSSAVAAIALFSVPVHAADDWFGGASSVNWTGVYIGANGGYGWNDADRSNITVFNQNGVLPTGPLEYTVDLDGAFGGGQIGYNHSFGGLVLGVEADIQAADINGSSRTAYPGIENVYSAFTYDVSTEINWFGTVRGRIGLECGPTLLYLTGGYAYGDVDYDATYLITANKAFANLHKSKTQDGYVLGGGIEHQLDKNWSFKAEYQYLNLGDEDVSGDLFFAENPPRASGETVTTNYDVELHTVRVGLNYRFGRDEPAVASLK